MFSHTFNDGAPPAGGHIHRRRFLYLIGAGGLAAAGYKLLWPDEGLWQPCLAPAVPAHLASFVQNAWHGVDPRQAWDCHVHLLGAGESGGGAWINPIMDSALHPLETARKRFFLNAACADDGQVDTQFIERLGGLHAGLPAGVRLMLLAFDYHYNDQGLRVPALSTFHVPNAYAAAVAQRYPQRFAWIASVHPYRADCVPALEWAARHGARAVKWLPSAMGMDPASPLCDRFYAALVRLRLPLLTHAGDELAVRSADQTLGNPLRLRRPLDQGVQVIVAHCASTGRNRDLDRGADAPLVSNFELFARLMDEPRYRQRLWGELSALTQINRMGAPLKTLIERRDWHARLINGSDYPLPAVMPLFSMRKLVRQGFITPAEAGALSEIRRYNPLLFDFVLKRTLKVGTLQFHPMVFHSRRAFMQTAVH